MTYHSSLGFLPGVVLQLAMDPHPLIDELVSTVVPAVAIDVAVTKLTHVLPAVGEVERPFAMLLVVFYASVINFSVFVSDSGSVNDSFVPPSLDDLAFGQEELALAVEVLALELAQVHGLVEIEHHAFGLIAVDEVAPGLESYVLEDGAVVVVHFAVAVQFIALQLSEDAGIRQHEFIEAGTLYFVLHLELADPLEERATSLITVHTFFSLQKPSLL